MSDPVVDIRLLQRHVADIVASLDNHHHDADTGGTGNPPGGGNLEARVARLESDVEYVKRDIGELKTEVKEHRKETRSDFRVLFGALITTAIGLAALMAKGFGWV